MSVPAIWQAMETLPAGFEIFTRVLTSLDASDVARMVQVEKRSCKSVQKLLLACRKLRARLALASLCFSRLRVVFQTNYQLLETQIIPRSKDSRVPPRVVPVWSESGQVTDGTVTLKPTELPSAHDDGVTACFMASAHVVGKRPILVDAVQMNRRIYTVVSVKLLKRGSDNEQTIDGDDSLTLRNYSYIKEFGEWKTLKLSEKRFLQFAEINSRQSRFDLVTQDSSMSLELEVPIGTDAQTNYYLVNQATVSIHLQELLQLHFQSLRPIHSLPEPSMREVCMIRIAFRSLAGHLHSRWLVPGNIMVESQEGDTRITRQQTGFEHFDIVTCRAHASSMKVILPEDPGYAWIEVRGTSETALSRRSCLYFYAVVLHYGERQITKHGGVRALHLHWLPGVLESRPTLRSRKRRYLKGNLSIATSSYESTLQDLTLTAQMLSSNRLERYAARIESYTRHEI